MAISYKGYGGKYGLVLSDGTKYVNCGDVIELNNASMLTVEALITNNDITQRRTVCGKGIYADNNNFFVIWEGSILYFWIGKGGINKYCSVTNSVSGITNNQLLHIVIVWDGYKVGINGGVKFYINGIKYNRTLNDFSSMGNMATKNFCVGYGREALQGNYYLFRYWKSVLTQSQAIGLYNRGAGIRTSLVGRKGWDDGLLVTEYLFTDGSGTTITDTTGNYNGTTVGSPSWTRT